MADEARDLDYSDIRAALTGKPVSASTEEAPAPPAESVEEKVETPAEGEQAPPAEGEKAPEQPEGEKQDRREKRFSKITKERDAERAARQALEARLAALEAAQAGKSAPAAEAAESDGKPAKPDADKFGTWDEYQKAIGEYEDKLTDWKVTKALAKKEQEAAIARQKEHYERVQGSWQKQLDELTEDNDDLEDAIKTVGDSVAKKGIIDVVKESEVGAKMVLYLHRNPAELAKVEGMSIASAARYLGKIEARLEGEAAVPASTSAKPAKPLPKPPTQVGGNPQGSAKSFDYQKASDEDFKAQLVREGIFKRR